MRLARSETETLKYMLGYYDVCNTSKEKIPNMQDMDFQLNTAS